MRLPAALCKIQRKKRETDGFSKSTLMPPPGSHPTSGFEARQGLPKFFRHKKRRIVQKRCGKLVDLEGFEPLTSRMRTERSPNSLAFVHTLCTVRKENQRIFVHIKRPAIPTAFLGRKYDLQAADFQDDAVWGVIWLADK